MKKFRKLLLSALAIVLIAVTSIAGTIAYLTDEDTAVNVMVLGEINIEQYEQDRNGNDFVQGQFLLPLVGTTSVKDANGYPAASNYIDKIVTVENTGKNAAYVRTFIAIPVYTYAGQDANNASCNVIHWNGYSQGDAAPNYPTATRIPGTDVDVDNNWSWGVDATSPAWPGNGGSWNVFPTVIDGQLFEVYVVTHVTPIEPDEITAPNLTGIYLDSKVDYDHDAGVYTYEGKVIEGFDGVVEVLVGTQAVQYDAGWGDAWTALNTSFGEPVNGHPWIEGAALPTDVFTWEGLTYITTDDDMTITAANGGDTVYRGIVSDGVNGVTNVTVAEGVTRLNNRAFCKSPTLTEVTLPESLTYIDESVFQQSGITEIVIPENVTYVAKMALGSCDKLEKIVIEAKNVTFANFVARDCANLKEVVIKSETVTFEAGGMYFTNKQSGDASAITFYVANQAVADALYNASSSCRGYGMLIVSLDGSHVYYDTLK